MYPVSKSAVRQRLREARRLWPAYVSAWTTESTKRPVWGLKIEMNPLMITRDARVSSLFSILKLYAKESSTIITLPVNRSPMEDGVMSVSLCTLEELSPSCVLILSASMFIIVLLCKDSNRSEMALFMAGIAIVGTDP